MRKDQLCHADPAAPLADWKVTTIGDDIAWIKPGADGRLYAINPEYGFFRRDHPAPPRARTRTPWDAEERFAYSLTSFLPRWRCLVGRHERGAAREFAGLARQALVPAMGTTAAIPDSRRFHGSGFAMSLASSRISETAEGVPDFRVHLRRQACAPCRSCTNLSDWIDGVYSAATMGSETTAAATGAVGQARNPFAMVPFCGYHIGDYFRHPGYGSALRSRIHRGSSA